MVTSLVYCGGAINVGSDDDDDDDDDDDGSVDPDFVS